MISVKLAVWCSMIFITGGASLAVALNQYLHPATEGRSPTDLLHDAVTLENQNGRAPFPVDWINSARVDALVDASQKQLPVPIQELPPDLSVKPLPSKTRAFMPAKQGAAESRQSKTGTIYCRPSAQVAKLADALP